MLFRASVSATRAPHPSPRASSAAANACADPERYRAQRCLLEASERLIARQREQLCQLVETDPVLAEAFGLKEAFRSIYQARNYPDAQRWLDTFLLAAEQAGLPAF